MTKQEIAKKIDETIGYLEKDKCTALLKKDVITILNTLKERLLENE